MKKLTQTRLHNPPKQRGNCYPTVIACFMDLDSPEEAIQIQEHYPEDINDSTWRDILFGWLNERGWDIEFLDDHLYDDSYYAVTGETIRGTMHICIYQNGKLYHDPHPDNTGIITERCFERLIKLS